VGVDPTRGLKFDSVPLVLQAAVSGAGVGIGRRQLVEAELAEGRLVAPFDLELPDAYAYYFVAPETTADQPKLAAFRDWLLAEVASSANH
jgi:LysR family glycine cleavage system transcriptional activator